MPVVIISRVGRSGGSNGGGVEVDSPCTLLFLAFSSMSSSGLDSFSAGLLRGPWREPFLSASFPTSFFVLSTVCFVPPGLVCVSPLVVVFTSPLCLVCESDSRDYLRKGILSQRLSSVGLKLEGYWEPARTALLRRLLENFFSFVNSIMVVFINKVIMSKNQG